MSRLVLIFLLLTGMAFPVWSQVRLLVATDSWPPFRIDAGADKFTGLDIDLLAELSRRTGIVFDIQRYPWARALSEMETGHVDMMTGLAFSDERAKFIDYIRPSYYSCHPAIYGPQKIADSVKTYADLGKYSVGYVLGSKYFEPFDSDQTQQKKSYTTEDQLMKVALRGRQELFVGTDCQVDYDLKLRELSAQVHKAPFRPEHTTELFMGFSRLSPNLALKSKIEQAVQQMQDDGTVLRMASIYLEQ
jgi:polar amino acid transport system substrate-binding protein